MIMIIQIKKASLLFVLLATLLSKSQFENFQSVMFGLIVSHCKEHDVKSIRDAISETKCQSSINRFFTSPSWSLDNIMKRAEDIVFSNLCTV
jgi:SRSO17 transposase